jgi:hypothetical protein
MNLLPLGNLVFGVHGDGLDRNVSYMPFLAFSPQPRKILQFIGGAPLIIFRPTDPRTTKEPMITIASAIQ